MRPTVPTLLSFAALVFGTSGVVAKLLALPVFLTEPTGTPGPRSTTA